MNRKQLNSALFAAKSVGLKVRYSVNPMSGVRGINFYYNNSGDSIRFDPYTQLGDSLLLAMKAKLDISFGEGEVFIRPNEGADNNTGVVITPFGNNIRTDTQELGQAIVDCINTMKIKGDKL